MSKIIEIIKNFNVQLALKNIFTKIDEIIKKLNDVDSDLANKEDYITPGTISQYWRGDKTWQTLPIHEIDGSLTSAQINDLDTTAIQIIAAPGANKMILVESVTTKFTYIAPAYTTTGEIWTTYDETDVNQRITALIDDFRLTSTSNQWLLNTGVYLKLYSTSIENKPIKLYCDAAISGGSGTIKYNIKYRIISF